MLFRHRKVQTKRRSQKKIQISLKQAQTLQAKYTGLPTIEPTQTKDSETFQTARNGLSFKENLEIDTSNLSGLVGELLAQLTQIKNQNAFLIERQAEMELNLGKKIDNMQKTQDELAEKLEYGSRELASFK